MRGDPVIKVYGIDFTGVPSRRKPITRIECELQDNLLLVESYGSGTVSPDSRIFYDSLVYRLPGLIFPSVSPVGSSKNRDGSLTLFEKQRISFKKSCAACVGDLLPN